MKIIRFRKKRSCYSAGPSKQVTSELKVMKSRDFVVTVWKNLIFQTCDTLERRLITQHHCWTSLMLQCLNGSKSVHPGSKTSQKTQSQVAHGFEMGCSTQVSTYFWPHSCILNDIIRYFMSSQCQCFSHQRTLQGKDGCRSRLLQRLHAVPPPAPPEAVRLPRLQVELPAEQRGVLPAFPLRFIRTLL